MDKRKLAIRNACYVYCTHIDGIPTGAIIDILKDLGISEEELIEAFTYWARHRFPK